MLLGVIADTHDQIERARRASERLRAAGAEALIHCGDIVSPAVVHAITEGPTFFVFGNNDRDREALAAAAQAAGATLLGAGSTITLGGRLIAVTHGDKPRELKRLLALEPAYLFVGHSHRRRDEQVGPTRIVNPGALHRAQPWSVALIDLARDEVTFMDVTDE